MHFADMTRLTSRSREDLTVAASETVRSPAVTPRPEALRFYLVAVAVCLRQ